MCPTGRALLAFGWITFGLLSILLPIVILHGILAERRRKHEEQQGGGRVWGRGSELTIDSAIVGPVMFLRRCPNPKNMRQGRKSIARIPKTSRAISPLQK